MPDPTLKEYYQAEILRSRRWSWWWVLRRAWRGNSENFLFWFRLADVMRHKGRFYKSLAKSINRRLIRKYSVEIMLGADIAPGLSVPHPVGIVVTKNIKAGKNFSIAQGTTIGMNRKEGAPICVGDNVSIGANATVIGPAITIGNNVSIGAMSFVNKDIPDHCKVYTRKECVIIPKQESVNPELDRVLYVV